MAKPASLDACCLLRWLLQDIPEQEQAVHQLLSKPGIYHVADATVIEVVYVLENLQAGTRFYRFLSHLAIAGPPFMPNST